jgi:hypothetical protein
MNTGREDARKARKYAVAPQVVWEEVDGEAVVVRCDRDIAWILNSCATRIWKGVAEGRGLEAIKRELAERWGYDPRSAGAALLRFIGRLVAAGLLLGPRPRFGGLCLAQDSNVKKSPELQQMELQYLQGEIGPLGFSDP